MIINKIEDIMPAVGYRLRGTFTPNIHPINGGVSGNTPFICLKSSINDFYPKLKTFWDEKKKRSFNWSKIDEKCYQFYFSIPGFCVFVKRDTEDVPTMFYLSESGYDDKGACVGFVWPDYMFIREDVLNKVIFKSNDIQPDFCEKDPNKKFEVIFHKEHSNGRYYSKWLYCRENNTCIKIGTTLSFYSTPLYPIVYFNKPNDGSFGLYYTDHSFIIWMDDNESVITYYKNPTTLENCWNTSFKYTGNKLVSNLSGLNDIGEILWTIDQLFTKFFDKDFPLLIGPENLDYPIVKFRNLISLLYFTNPTKISEGKSYENWDLDKYRSDALSKDDPEIVNSLISFGQGGDFIRELMNRVKN